MRHLQRFNEQNVDKLIVGFKGELGQIASHSSMFSTVNFFAIRSSVVVLYICIVPREVHSLKAGHFMSKLIFMYL